MKKTGLQNYRLILEYDGAAFSGFQRQPLRLTVQEALETAMHRLYGKKMSIKSASGRTDAGVHARFQVVNFFAPARFKTFQIQRALNAILPKSAAVIQLDKAPPGFHSRFQARRKTYEYRIWNSPVRSPLRALQTWHVPYTLDLKKMRQAAKYLVGKHDFQGFCTMGIDGMKKNTERRIFKLDLKKQGHEIQVLVEADGFLYHMVRILAGTLVAVGRGKMSPGDIPKILKSKNRGHKGATAPAHALCLVDVTY